MNLVKSYNNKKKVLSYKYMLFHPNFTCNNIMKIILLTTKFIIHLLELILDVLMSFSYYLEVHFDKLKILLIA